MKAAVLASPKPRSGHSKSHPDGCFSKASWSPGRVLVASRVPAGSSSTEFARRLKAMRPRLTFARVLTTLFLRSRKTTSIGNLIPNVCTASQTAIHRPSPGSIPACPRKPVRLLEAVSAISARLASRVPRVTLVTRSLIKSIAPRDRAPWRRIESLRRCFPKLCLREQFVHRLVSTASARYFRGRRAAS